MFALPHFRDTNRCPVRWKMLSGRYAIASPEINAFQRASDTLSW
jgi:hypothetical protein